jgi:thermolabile hemolysin
MANHMQRFLIISGLVLSASLAPVRAIAATFRQIVVYGDSLSDLGRASLATGGAAPPYSTLTGGKFSNGKIWIEYLADDLGIRTNPATNFAVGGATTGTTNTIQTLIPFPVTGLVGIQQEVANNSISDPNALYVIWGGANDYLGGGITNPAIPVTNLTTEIGTLIARGAKNILVPNLANLGALPSTNGNIATAGLLNSLTLAHNTGLATSINTLSQLNPSVKLSLLDTNLLFNQIVANPSNFGITNVTDRCLTSSSVCANPNSYLFWDDLHPTTTGNKLIGDLAFQTLTATAVPEPTMMWGSLVAFSSAIALKRKIKAAKLTAKKLVKAI